MEVTINKWDYRVAVRTSDGHSTEQWEIDGIRQTVLNEGSLLTDNGSEGWELIAVLPTVGPGTKYYFKRPATS